MLAGGGESVLLGEALALLAKPSGSESAVGSGPSRSSAAEAVHVRGRLQPGTHRFPCKARHAPRRGAGTRRRGGARIHGRQHPARLRGSLWQFESSGYPVTRRHRGLPRGSARVGTVGRQHPDGVIGAAPPWPTARLQAVRWPAGSAEVGWGVESAGWLGCAQRLALSGDSLVEMKIAGRWELPDRFGRYARGN